MKAYKQIRAIRMAETNSIEEIEFFELPRLSDVTYADGQIEGDDLLLTKDSVIKDAEDIVISGYGSQAGTKLWQTDTGFIKQVKCLLNKGDIV